MKSTLLRPIFASSMLIAALPLQCAALSLWATDSPNLADNFDLNVWKIKQNFLVLDASGQPTLDFHEENPHNRELVDALEDGAPGIRSAGTRTEIAAELMKFSGICDIDKMALNINLSPPPGPSIPTVDRPMFERITSLAIVGCLKKLPEDCSYYAGDSRDKVMNFGDLVFMRTIKACYEAVAGDLARNGQPDASAPDLGSR